MCKSSKTKKDDSTEQDQKRNPTKKIHQVVDDLYSPTYAFKGVKQYIVQPQVKSTQSSTWKEINFKMQIDNGVAANWLKLEDYNRIEDTPEREE